MTLERIESQIQQMPFSDQLRLLETLAGQIRRRGVAVDSRLQDHLAAMAEDPQMQQELRAIEAEFSGTEVDGLKAA